MHEKENVVFSKQLLQVMSAHAYWDFFNPATSRIILYINSSFDSFVLFGPINIVELIESGAVGNYFHDQTANLQSNNLEEAQN